MIFLSALLFNVVVFTYFRLPTIFIFIKILNNQCTHACGEGRQLRDTWCSYTDMETYQEIKTSSCVQPGPATVRECNRGDCKSKWLWKTGDWGQVINVLAVRFTESLICKNKVNLFICSVHLKFNIQNFHSF